MQKNRTMLVAVAVVLLVIVSSYAQSKPAFTFKIPVDIQDLHPDVDKIRLVVKLYTKPHGVTSFGSASAVSVGTKVANIGPSQRIVTTVTLPMNPKDPEKLKSYYCGLQIHNKKKKEWRSFNRMASTPSWYRIEEGSAPGYGGAL